MGSTTIPAHLVRRLRERGVDTGFGIVGDYALRLFGRFEELAFPVLVTADEQGAAFAADAYARLRGLGMVAVTFGVGGLKVANATACAWAEQVPMLVVSGAPGMGERRNNPMLHHKVKTFETQLDVFSDLTCAQAVLSNPAIAAEEIDRVLSTMLAEQRPGYIEVPRDMLDAPIISPDGALTLPSPLVDEAALREAVADVMGRLGPSARPVLATGVMAWRRGLSRDIAELAQLLNAPVTTTSLSKGMFPERHPLSLGVYMGAVSASEVVSRVEAADPLLAFGALYTDLTMGGFTDHIDRSRLIHATDHQVHAGHRTYEHVPLSVFLPALLGAVRETVREARIAYTLRRPGFHPKDVSLSVETVVKCLEAALDARHGLIVEPGDSLFGSVELSAPAWTLSNGYYATMGYAVAAALGAGIADREKRPVVLVGDGGFLMTGLEVAAAVFHGLAPIVIILDNEGYGTQRPMLDGAFNDIPTLRSELLPGVIGSGKGHLCTTEVELASALADAIASNQVTVIRARVPKRKPSAALQRLTVALSKRV